MPTDLARVAFASVEYRQTTSEDLTVQTRHPMAIQLDYNTYISNATDAQAFGDFVLGLRKIDRDTWQCFLNEYTIRTDSIPNLIGSPYTLSDAIFASGASLYTSGTGSRPADAVSAKLSAVNSTVTWVGSYGTASVIRVAAGDTLYFSHTVKSDSVNDHVRGGCAFFTSSGTALTSLDIPLSVVTGDESLNAFVDKSGTVVVPATAAWAQPYTVRPAFTSGNFYVGEPRVTKTPVSSDGGRAFTLGDTITIVYPRFGFDVGANFIVKRIKRDASSQFVELSLFGPQ